MELTKEFDEAAYEEAVKEIVNQPDRNTQIRMIQQIFLKKNNKEIAAEYGKRLASDERITKIVGLMTKVREDNEQEEVKNSDK